MGGCLCYLCLGDTYIQIAYVLIHDMGIFEAWTGLRKECCHIKYYIFLFFNGFLEQF